MIQFALVFIISWVAQSQDSSAGGANQQLVKALREEKGIREATQNWQQHQEKLYEELTKKDRDVLDKSLNDKQVLPLSPKLRWLGQGLEQVPVSERLEIAEMIQSFDALKKRTDHFRDSVPAYVELSVQLQTLSDVCEREGQSLCTLKVQTLDADTKQETKGCDVQFIRKYWFVAGDKSKWKSFDKQSSPTSQRLNGSNYMLRCRRLVGNEWLVGPNKECRLDGDKTIDLQAPRKP